MLLANYTPACVLVSEKGGGHYFHGNTGRYLQPPDGEANWNIIGLAREGLRLDLTTALRKVANHKKPVRFEKVKVKTNGGSQFINLTVMPVSEESGQGAPMLVVFEEIAAPEATESLEFSEPSTAADHRVSELERELRSNREYLQTTIEELETSNEELKSTNEELQSSNEELQSTNEEMETSKEELQSVNEELVTVNSEHEGKLDVISKANNDMANLLASTDVGTIFLSNDLRIQRYTPAAARVVNLIQSDIGRPLSDIATKIKDEYFTPMVAGVLDTLEPKEKEVQTDAGHWYSVRVRPYRTTENIIEGAVITFVDITEQKEAQEKLLTLSQAVEQSPNSVIITDTEGKIEFVNTYFTRQSGYADEEAVGREVNIINSGKMPASLFKTMWRTIKAGKNWEGDLQNQRKDGSLYWERVSIYPVKDKGGNLIHFVGIQTRIAEQE